MNILVVNDDGYKAEGLALLVRALTPFGNLYVAAPKHHQSGMSQAITFNRRIETFMTDPLIGAKEMLVVDGTPADCVRLGLKLFDVDFDLVVSGINYGQNIAKDILYSGTVAAAFEAKILGVDAIAISAPRPDIDYLYDETIKIMDEIIETGIYHGDGILNINFPKIEFTKPKGVKITSQGERYQYAEYVKSETPDSYHVRSSIIQYEEADHSDVAAYETGYISVTPLKINRTDMAKIKDIMGE